MIRLEYQDWLWFYDILDTEDNYALWLDMYSYGGEQLILPIDVNEDEYNAKLSLDAVNDSESEASSESDTSESDNDSSDSGSVLYPDLERELEEPKEASETEVRRLKVRITSPTARTKKDIAAGVTKVPGRFHDMKNFQI